MTISTTKRWRATSTVTEDPWHHLAPTPNADLLSARRVDASLPYGFFWAKGADRRCLLLLQHSTPLPGGRRLPKLNGIEVAENASDETGLAVLSLRLQDSSQRELFYRLCLDIVASAGAAKSEEEAVAATLARTWRWHHLLRGGGDGRLTPEEQKGLLGELSLLKRLLGLLSPLDAVQAWRGPVGAPKDFEVGRCSIEAKARRGAATPYVAVSSEHQLDASGVGLLLLFVQEVDHVPNDNPDGATLSDVAVGLRRTLTDRDPGACALFESLLSSAGFRWEDDYSDTKWFCGRELLFRVAPGFPSITPSSFPAGVLNVRYAISLSACEPFRVPTEALGSLLQGESSVD